MKRLFGILLLLFLSACSSPNIKTSTVVKINNEMDALVNESVSPSKPEAVSKALLPPLAMALPKAESGPLDARFDLTVNSTPAKEVFAAIGSGTRYNMLPLPGVEGNITLNLKDVTVFEALDTIRALYGYEYKVEGKSIYIQPVSLQIKLFKIDYLAAMRDSSSSLSVKASGQVNPTGLPGVATAGVTATGVTAAATGAFSAGNNSSSVSTKQSSADFNFWENLDKALNAIIAPKDKEKASQGERSVVINRMSGVIVIRAMPEELRNVAEFLKASQLSVERQVIIEAKFVEVTLSDSFQSGVNWGVFGQGGVQNRVSAGVVSQGGTLVPNAAEGAAQRLTNSAITGIPGSSLGGVATGASGSLFGLALQTNQFAAMLNFLESQGSVHVLSSPRIATLNNQKAVLKVGTDEPYATGFTPGTSTTVAGGANTLPTPIYTQIFSGIALDVTPRINEKDEIILHVHPSISQVTSKVKDAGSGTTMQMASTSIEETDSVVRAKDGQIVVIGGLMSQSTAASESGLPGWVKTMLGQTSKASEKRELVILLKPTVVDSDKDWSDDITRSRDRMNGMSR
ncbi:MAG: general secretion pathway protein GspD [Gallionellaceae bacterium]|nr:MAG: general secretion pathway protein GspD [Gallionellaceae bacterium]